MGTMINGERHQTDNGIIEKYCFNNNEEFNCITFGGLYQWDEMMKYTTTVGAQGICPEGWHIPSDDEWKIMEGNVDSYYGVGDLEWDITGWRGSDIGYKLKVNTGWAESGNGNDAYGFSGRPAGFCDTDGSFIGITSHEMWWLTDSAPTADAWIRFIHYSVTETKRENYGVNFHHYGFSVRCIKDD